MTNFLIDFEPVGKRVSVSETTSLLSATQDAGLSLTAVCGGVGICQDCKIRCVSGKLSEIQLIERDAFSPQELQHGWRLACQAYPRSDLIIEIPLESMATEQRLQIEGEIRKVAVQPAVYALDFSLDPPNLKDLRGDWERLVNGIPDKQVLQNNPGLPVINQFSVKMRRSGWAGRVIIGKNQCIVGFLTEGQAFYGVAVDVGTTKLAVFIKDLSTGETIAKDGVMNPQIAFGEDVVSRIASANSNRLSQNALQEKLVDAINRLVGRLIDEKGIVEDQIVDYVVVGNTAMHHFFAGLPVQQLGEAPYVPAVCRSLNFSARDIGLNGAPNARVYMPPNIAGYVGADHIAMLLATDTPSREGVSIALDIGTNTEISLALNGKLISCSCASGPAFEGAHIQDGMRAVPGAIERALFFDGDWHYSTVADKPPVGICGSGILDIVASLYESGQIDASGRFTEHAFRLVNRPKGGAIIMVPGKDSGTGKDILVTRRDIREIQLAKAAIRAGIEALLRATVVDLAEIKKFIVAGAFGTYLHLDSALKIGMFPKLPTDCFLQVGNAAGAGAQEMLLSLASRKAAESILENLTYLELTTDPGFIQSYVESMGFD